jgi:hypothetical protein
MYDGDKAEKIYLNELHKSIENRNDHFAVGCIYSLQKKDNNNAAGEANQQTTITVENVLKSESLVES